MDEWTLDLLKDLRDHIFGSLIGRGLQDPNVEIPADKALRFYKRIEGAIAREQKRRIEKALAGRYAAAERRKASRERMIKKFDRE